MSESDVQYDSELFIRARNRHTTFRGVSCCSKILKFKQLHLSKISATKRFNEAFMLFATSHLNK